MKEIARLHGIPRKIVSDKDTKLIQFFGKDYSKDLVQIRTLSHHTIHSQMRRQRGSTEQLKTC